MRESRSPAKSGSVRLGPATSPSPPGRRPLPLVVAVDCFGDEWSRAAVRSALRGTASLVGCGHGWAPDCSVLDGASVVLTRSLYELSRDAAGRLRGAQAVVLTAPWEGDAEAALASEFSVRRLVTACPGLEEERADTELALILSLTRRTAPLAKALAAGAWLPTPGAYRGARRLACLTLGVVGLDACAAGVVRRAAAGFAMRVLFVPTLDADGVFEPGVVAAGGKRASSLEALLDEADVVVIHAAHGAGCVLGAAQVARLRKGAFVVHTGPSGCVDTPSLKRALADGRLAGVGIDAPDVEHWMEAAARERGTVLLTPRASRHSEEAYAAAAAAAGSAARAVLRGER